jgi:prepilin-type processing-associated H-X9-DG protein
MTIDAGISGGEPPATPIELRRNRDGLQLVAVWSDGRRTALTARMLRAACRCAQCSARRLRGELEAIVDPIAIAALVPIGDYAVNIAFSDGHARGIFPWAMLRALSDATAGN